MTSRLRLPTALPGARLSGLGSVQPDNVVTNEDLAARMDTEDAWIRDRVGIQSRRIAEQDQTLVDMASEAGSRAATRGLVGLVSAGRCGSSRAARGSACPLRRWRPPPADCGRARVACPRADP